MRIATRTGFLHARLSVVGVYKLELETLTQSMAMHTGPLHAAAQMIVY